MNGLYTACGVFVMKLCLWGMAAIATCIVFAVLAREAKRCAKTFRRVGFVASLLLGTFIFGMIREGTVTQEDKEEYRDGMAPIMEERAAMPSILLPTDSDDLAKRNDSSKDEDDLNALAKESDTNTDSSEPGQDIRSGQQGISDSDYEAGVILAEVRTNEVHDFTAPTNSVWHQDWLDHGGFADNFRFELDGLEFPFGTNSISALTVFQRGLMRPRTVVASSFIAPMQARLGAVPSFRHSLLPEANRPSGFWHCFTPSNSVVMTWRNFLLGQDALCPVTLQAELFEDGCAEFRYDLSQAGAETITNIVAGIRCNSLGTTLDSLDANVTTIRWQRLNPEDVANPDPDGDGISTCDEIFVYRTDPYNADSDYDGVTDYDEVNVYNSDPNDAHSINPLYCDSFALVLGDEDPFAYPEGSTNTIYEHILYTGTTNAPFAYPVSTDEIGVLKIMVSGSGAGRLVVGDAVVPLLGSQTGLTRLTGLRGGANPDNPVNPVTNTLLLVVGKGVRKTLWWEKPDGLDVAIDSDDLLIGELPTLLRLKGWIAFPHTDATVPCIHDLEAKGTVLSLVHGEEFSGLTALWQCASPSVVITNFPPVSADVHASFSTRGSTEISYTVDHPDRLNVYAPSFEQTLEFCPKLTPEEETSLYGSPEEHSYTNMCHCVEPQGIVCGCCAYGTCNCPNPKCPCYENPFIAPDETSEADAEDEYDAVMALSEALNVLQLHGSVATQDVVYLDVPDEYRKCCACPDHWTNHVALAYRSQRLSVTDASGAEFSVTNLDCNVVMRGLEPSIAPFDDAVLFSTNGASYLSRKYTMLGVRMNSPCGYDTSVFNALSPSFGVPVTVNTNLMNAARFELHTDILLSNGLVRVALENATCGAQVWLPEYTVWRFDDNDMWLENHPPVLLLDADTMPERYFTIRQWRSIMRNRGSDRTQPLMVVSPDAGRLDFVFSYATAHGDHAIKTGIRQRVTFVKPPLLPDYDRDGKIGMSDVERYLRSPMFRYWINECKVTGDVWEELSLFQGIADAVVGLENWRNDHVDGRYDLINLFPVAVSAEPFLDAWGGSGSVNVKIRCLDGDDVFRFTLANVGHSDAGSVRTAPRSNIAGQPLHSATMDWLTNSLTVSSAQYDANFDLNSALLVCEAAKSTWLGLLLSVEVDGKTMYSFRLPMSMSAVDDMYRYVSIRGAYDNVMTTFEGTNAPPNNPDCELGDKDVFFVHGFNVSPENARIWNREMFKRFWVSGMNARYWGVTWSGDYHVLSEDFNGLHYHRDVRQALMTAPTFRNLVNSNGVDAVVIGHSLGNMVVSEALLRGANASTYIMLDAAVASEAYRPELQGESTQITDKYVPSDWDGYNERTWAANWYTWFTNDVNDARGKIGWAGHFAPLLNRQGLDVFNFYSSGDEVFDESTNGTPGLVTGVFHWPTLNLDWPFLHLNLELDAFPWQKQEVFKGVNAAGSLSAGWGFHCWRTNINNEAVWVRYSAAGANAMVSDGSIVTNAVFDRGVSAMFSLTISDYDIADILAFHIPSVSSPAGKVETFLDEDMYYDMNARGRANDWGRPSDPDLPEGAKMPWLHSDIKNMAYYYVYPSFTNIVEKGELR